MKQSNPLNFLLPNESNQKKLNMKTIFFLCLINLCFILKSNAQNAGDSLFSPNHVYEINLNFSQPSYWDSLVNNYTLDQYMAATFTIDGVSLSFCRC